MVVNRLAENSGGYCFMERSANTGLRNSGLKMSLTTLVLVVEAGSAGFYVTVTRSLAPIFMAFLGFSITGIMLVTSIAYLIALAVILLLRWHGVRRIRNMLLVSHGVERVAWGLLPLTAVLDWRMLVAVYALAVSFAAITGLLIGVVVYNVPGENGPRRLIAYRNAAFTATSIIGSLTSIIVLAAMSSYFKYIYLYTLAAIIGLLATILLALVKLPVADEASAINSTVT
ncbi:MAG: hypothetical protein OWQ48_01995 [Desulfurococcus sp.]|nr:hypothetical protein [Desulfurococcus sp.]